MDLQIGIDLGAIVWLALALAGAALIVGGIIIFLIRKTGSARVLASTAVAVGLIMWAILLLTLPVSTNVDNSQPTTELRDQPLLPKPKESDIQSSYGSRGDTEGHLIQILETKLELDQLVNHYQQQIQDDGWDLPSILMEDDLSVLTWTFSDVNDQPYKGILILTPARENKWLVSETFVVILP